MSTALYRKYRSKSLSDVVGQDHITDVLSRSLKAGKIAHAYLLTGPRGVGKTSIARILAHEINQLPYDDDSQHLDIIEIDAASNNGVDDIRELREKVQIAPTSASKKVYIIDEVHMLSKPAFNALLKTLEEPPEHVVFILATTDVEKLPATIISRTQRFGFRAIGVENAMAHLKHIAEQEKIKISNEALQLVAERGDGSFRDSISLLDQLSGLSDDKTGITVELVENVLGLAPKTMVSNLLEAVDKHNTKGLASSLLDAEASGINPIVLASQITQALRTKAPKHPHLFALIDSLLDVPKSSQPSIKLLSALGSASIPTKPKTAALATPTLEVSATIAELEKAATKPVAETAPQPATESAQTLPPSQATPTPPSQPQSKPTPQPNQSEPTLPASQIAPTPQPNQSEPTPAPVAPSDFDWQALVEHTRQNFVALYSVLSKCTPELIDNNITLYTKNAFYKKKLDDPKYSVSLHQSMQELGMGRFNLETVPSPAPMKNSQAAAIADIMGGGTEVSLSDVA